MDFNPPLEKNECMMVVKCHWFKTFNSQVVFSLFSMFVYCKGEDSLQTKNGASYYVTYYIVQFNLYLRECSRSSLL